MTDTPRTNATPSETPRVDAFAQEALTVLDGETRAEALAKQWSDFARELERDLERWKYRADVLERDLTAARKERDEALTALHGIKEYRERNPLGGPAKVFDAMADLIRAGEEFYDVLADYQFCTMEQRDAALRDAERLREATGAIASTREIERC